jgi:hypothetical protein
MRKNECSEIKRKKYEPRENSGWKNCIGKEKYNTFNKIYHNGANE